MPVVAVGMIYYGGTALAAGAVGWAALAAGTMVVGGAASLVGTATGDKKLESDGMTVGTIGSLGYGALSAGGYSGVAGQKAVEGSAATTNYTTGIDDTAKVPMGSAASAGKSGSTAINTGSGSTTTSNTDVAALFAKHDANMANIAKQNLIAQTASGVAQAYSGYEQSKQAKETADEMRAEQTRLTERDYANRNNLLGLTTPTVTGLPNLTKQAQQRGLISAPTTLQTAKV